MSKLTYRRRASISSLSLPQSTVYCICLHSLIYKTGVEMYLNMLRVRIWKETPTSVFFMSLWIPVLTVFHNLWKSLVVDWGIGKIWNLTLWKLLLPISTRKVKLLADDTLGQRHKNMGPERLLRDHLAHLEGRLLDWVSSFPRVVLALCQLITFCAIGFA